MVKRRIVSSREIAEHPRKSLSAKDYVGSEGMTKRRFTVSVLESGVVEVPDDVVAAGEDAVYEYLHEMSGSPWGRLSVENVKVHSFEFATDELEG